MFAIKSCDEIKNNNEKIQHQWPEFNEELFSIKENSENSFGK